MKQTLFLLFLFSCAKPFAKEFSLNGPYIKDGKCLLNIGHRVGGDFKGLRDNRINSALKIKHLEYHKCFKGWEFDIASAKDGLIIYHDPKYKGKRPYKYPMHKIKAPKFNKFLDELESIVEKRKLVFDLKRVKKEHWDELLDRVPMLRDNQGMVFVTSHKHKERYRDLAVKAKLMGVGFRYY